MTDLFHAAGDVLFDWLSLTAVHVAVLVVVIAIAQRLLGRWLTPRWRYALWLLVVARLLLPAVPDSTFSVHNLASADAPVDTAAPDPPDPPDPPERGTAAATAPARSGERTKTAERRSDDVEPNAETAVAPTSGSFSMLPMGDTESRESDSPVAGVVTAAAPWKSILIATWGGVALAWLVVLSLRERSFVRRITSEPEIENARVLGVYRAVADDLRMRRRVRLVATDLVESPALMGVVRPRLLLPSELVDTLTDAELSAVFRHELAHLRAGDVLANWLLAGLRAVHWFNPFVAYAFHRIRVERETVRDLGALSGASSDARAAYGRTLLRLVEVGVRGPTPAGAVGILESRGDLKRRVEMIAAFRGNKRRAAALGAFVLTLTAACAMTDATVAPARAQERSAGDGSAVLRVGSESVTVDGAFFLQSLERIKVERQTEEPAWKASLRRKLSSGVNSEGAKMEVSTFIRLQREGLGVNIVFDPDAESDVGHRIVQVPAGDNTPADRLLRVVLAQADLDYALSDGVVFVARIGEMYSDVDRRFYDVREMLQATADRLNEQFGVEGEFEVSSLEEELISVVQALTNYALWDREGVSIDRWKGLLVVNQTDEGHAETRQVLEMLLNRGRSNRTEPAWRAEMEKNLAKTVSFNFVETPIRDAAEYVGSVSGVTVVVDEDIAEDAVIDLKMDDVTAATALNWFARSAHTNVAFDEGVVAITRAPPLEVRCYHVSDIARARSQSAEPMYDGLIELMQNSVLPNSWADLDGSLIIPWDGMLIVRNTETVHEGLDELFASLRRVFDENE